VLQLLDAVHGLLRSGRTATQRDLYYTVSPLFTVELHKSLEHYSQHSAAFLLLHAA
jgi:DNA topoisomerase VI subunit A